MMMKKKILVVDDEAFFIDLFRETLKDSYDVLEAVDAISAKKMVYRLKPDLILMDVDLPDESGLDVCRELKEDFITKEIPIILVGSGLHQENPLLEMNIGADDYITKPAHKPEILARIDSHLKASGFYSMLRHQDLVLLLELSATLTTSRNPVHILHAIVTKMKKAMDIERCSILSINGNNKLSVRASSDHMGYDEIPIDIEKYPEIKASLNTRKPVLINDIKHHSMMAPVKDRVADLKFNSMVVVPIVRKESVIGTLFLKTSSQDVDGIDDRFLTLCELTANIAANALENAVIFENMEAKQLMLAEMAITDDLTGLFNRRHFYKRLDEEFSRADRYDTLFSCIFCDIDNFKKINDMYGHQCGDEVLEGVGAMIRHIVRESDIPARYGGEEFSILLAETGEKGALKLANRIHEKVRQSTFDGLNAHQVTISIGVVVYNKNSIKSPDHMVQLADNAMYQAKSMGKDRVVLARKQAYS